MEDMIDMSNWSIKQNNTCIIDSINQVFKNYVNDKYYKSNKSKYEKFTTIKGLYNQMNKTDEITYVVELISNGIWIWELNTIVLTDNEKSRLTELYEKIYE